MSPASLLLASVILSLSVAALVAYFRARENALQRDSIRQRTALDDTIRALGAAHDAATNTQQNAESARRTNSIFLANRKRSPAPGRIYIGLINDVRDVSTIKAWRIGSIS